ncbi:MAG: methyltransferase domain-containing protein [Verrucomicrobia bacterium]|nr:methyltransferase domain-containing protein [Verrucomicrobiota bacterium]
MNFSFNYVKLNLFTIISTLLCSLSLFAGEKLGGKISEAQALRPGSAWKKDDLLLSYAKYFDEIRNKNRERLTGHLHLGLFDDNCEGKSLKELQENMIHFVLGNLRENAHALDIGCGVGGTALIALQKNPSLKIDAIDFLEINVQKARKLIHSNNLEGRCKLINLDAHYMSFSENTYDYAWAFEALMYMDQPIVLQKVFGVLKDQGVFKFCDFCIKEPLSEEDEVFIREEEFMSLLKESDYRILMGKIGFKDIEIVDLTNRIYPNFIVFYPESKAMCKLIEQGKIRYILVKATAVKSSLF